jgi:hypothetical protein
MFKPFSVPVQNKLHFKLYLSEPCCCQKSYGDGKFGRIHLSITWHISACNFSSNIVINICVVVVVVVVSFLFT